ncbi:hypothetical protein [Capybara microvirus Cap1_SP_135]|nr:hypothetical protein [Capybara microvirus Cap1_SP_135]
MLFNLKYYNKCENPDFPPLLVPQKTIVEGSEEVIFLEHVPQNDFPSDMYDLQNLKSAGISPTQFRGGSVPSTSRLSDQSKADAIVKNIVNALNTQENE